jgi:Putative zinc-finger
MTDCTNLEMRDLLPDYARGALTGPPVMAVEQHLASCASCRAELAVVRSALAALGDAPRVDTARIVAAVGRSRRTRQRVTRRVWLAAASIAAIAGAAALARNVANDSGSSSGPPVVVIVQDDSARATPVPPTPNAPSRPSTRQQENAELVVGGGVADLADADLEALLAMLDGLDAQIDVEPTALPVLLEGEV